MEHKRINIYTTDEVAEILMVTRRTVYNYIDSGSLKATKIGKSWRITEEQLRDFISKGTDGSYTEKNSTSTNKH